MPLRRLLLASVASLSLVGARSYANIQPLIRPTHLSFQLLLAREYELLNTIYKHPFNQQLADGTLPPATYETYLRDDRTYLKGYATVLTNLANRYRRLHDEKAYAFFMTQVEVTLAMESELSRHIILHEKTPRKPNRAISHYLNHLIPISEHASFAVALASITPCYFIYYQLGLKMKSPSEGNPYHDWIITYQGPVFKQATLNMIRRLNKELVNIPINSDAAKVVYNAFHQSIQDELRFLNSLNVTNNLAIHPTKF